MLRVTLDLSLYLSPINIARNIFIGFSKLIVARMSLPRAHLFTAQRTCVKIRPRHHPYRPGISPSLSYHPAILETISCRGREIQFTVRRTYVTKINLFGMNPRHHRVAHTAAIRFTRRTD